MVLKECKRTKIHQYMICSNQHHACLEFLNPSLQVGVSRPWEDEGFSPDEPHRETDGNKIDTIQLEELPLMSEVF